MGGDRGISPVVGVALLLAIVVALAAVTGYILLDFSNELEAPSPYAAQQGHIKIRVDNGSVTDQRLVLSHHGGDPVDVATTKIKIHDGSGRTIVDTPEVAGDVADGTWSVGEELPISLNTSILCEGDGPLQVDVVSTSGSAAVIGQMRVPLKHGQFVIGGGRVTATTDYTANVKFVGTGWSSSYLDPPVNVSVMVDGTTAKRWSMVHDTTHVVGSYGISRQSSGTSIEIRAAGAQPTIGGHDWTRVSSSSNSQNVKVYRDDDAAPSFSAGGGQANVTAYVDPYVEDGRISLEENQAIYLFDFNDHDRDYQDAVVLVSFFTKHNVGATVYRSGDTTALVCPARTKSANPNP